MSFGPNWPSPYHFLWIPTIGFPHSLLPKLRDAIDNDEAVWIRQTTDNDRHMWYYEWNGCLFEIEEIDECVARARLKEWMCEVKQNTIKNPVFGS